jgi:hypothetical protein
MLPEGASDMKSPFRQPSENEEDFNAMLSVSEHANQYAVVFDAAKAVAARYGVLPWYGASDQDLISAEIQGKKAPETEEGEESVIC